MPVGVSAVVVVPETFSREVFGSEDVLVGLIGSPVLALSVTLCFVLIATVASSASADHGFDIVDFELVISNLSLVTVARFGLTSEIENDDNLFPWCNLESLAGRHGRQHQLRAFWETDSKSIAVVGTVPNFYQIVSFLSPLPRFMYIDTKII